MTTTESTIATETRCTKTERSCEESTSFSEEDSMMDFEDESDLESGESKPELDVNKLLTKKARKNANTEVLQLLYNSVIGGVVLAVIVIAGSCTEWFGFIPNTTVPEELFEGDREGLKRYEENAAMAKNPTTANGMMGMVQNFMPEGGMEDMMKNMQDAMGQFGEMFQGPDEEDEDATKTWKAPATEAGAGLLGNLFKDGQLNTNSINNMIDAFANDTENIYIGETGEKFLAERNITRKVRVSKATQANLNKFFEEGWEFSRRSVCDPTDIQFQGTLKKEHKHANKEKILKEFLVPAWKQNKSSPSQQFPHLRSEFYSMDVVAKNPKGEEVACPGYWQCTSAAGVANPTINWENADVWTKQKHDYLEGDECVVREEENGYGRSLNIQVKFDKQNSTQKSVAVWANTTPDLRGPRQDDSNNPLYLALQAHLAQKNFSKSEYEQMHLFLTSPYDMNGKGDMNNVFKEFDYEFRFHFVKKNVTKANKQKEHDNVEKALKNDILSQEVLSAFMKKRSETAKQNFNADRRAMEGFYDESAMKYQWQEIQFDKSFEASSRYNEETKMLHLEGKFVIKFATAPSCWSACASPFQRICGCCGGNAWRQ